MAILAEHDLFKQLRGNPQSVTLLACCRANPLAERPLKDLYRLIKSDAIQCIFTDEDKNLKTNEISLRISSEASIALLKDSSPESFTFFYFLGLLPGGVYEHQL